MLRTLLSILNLIHISRSLQVLQRDTRPRLRCFMKTRLDIRLTGAPASSMFELLVSAAHAHLLAAENGATAAVLGEKHAAVHTNQLNLVGNSNQVYNRLCHVVSQSSVPSLSKVRPDSAVGLTVAVGKKTRTGSRGPVAF